MNPDRIVVGAESNRAKEILEKVYKPFKETVYGERTQTRSFCYIDDLIEGIFKISITEDLAGEVSNLRNPEEYKIIDFAQIIKELTNSKFHIVFKPLPQDDPKQRKPDIARIKTTLQWEPKISLNEGLKKTINWFKEKLS